MLAERGEVKESKRNSTTVPYPGSRDTPTTTNTPPRISASTPTNPSMGQFVRTNPKILLIPLLGKRKTTNCCCLILPIILAIYFVARVVYTHINGWPTSLMHPRDFRGQLCGVGRRSDEKYLYYLAPTKDLNVAICVDECPSTTGKPIFIYEGRSKENTPFFYTQIQCDTVGNYCYPQEYKPREKVDKKLSEYENVFLRIISDLYNVSSSIFYSSHSIIDDRFLTLDI